MIALVVKVTVKPAYRESFIEATLDDAKGSVHNESGCLRFDVLNEKGDPNTFWLYEVYQNEEAVEAHMRTPHYLRWRETVKDWFAAARVRHECLTIYPQDSMWRKASA